MYKIVCYLDQEVKINMRVITHQGGLFLQCVVGRSVSRFPQNLDGNWISAQNRAP